MTFGKKDQERNKKLKIRAVQLENKLNEIIKSGLNRESVFELVGLESEKKAENLRRLREQVEVLSLQFNFPTKNDVANLAKMLIQVEEKIDSLEEKLEVGFQSAKLKPDAPNRGVIKNRKTPTPTRVLLKINNSSKSNVKGTEEKIARFREGENHG
ncbi:hypothetical protein [Sutcliffiella rhizosphaerae]|uniref:Uncharacterized protein n=1 Tax=Sutcliffiella rhizosphaerae TaxID=2880967 RepID=A0ABM8YLV6_9BACI|nr:hypothetical protein [Sutcliffiella rhizosphaerae]CAG9620971.1 hypothetical protein BACCIP111883_01743 [Sutcliffiella rhizosphaerae]